MTDLYKLMLGMMAGGQSAVDARSSLMRMVSEQEGMDPTTRALLAQAMSGGAENGHEEAVEVVSEDGATRRQHAQRRLRDRFDAMQEELEELWERQDRLAAALGACPECWGEDPECEACGGMGSPGSFRPDPRLYRQLVSPANRAVQAERQRRQVRSSDPQVTLATGGET